MRVTATLLRMVVLQCNRRHLDGGDASTAGWCLVASSRRT